MYANNAPPPDAKTLADLKTDAAMRFNVAASSIEMLAPDGHVMSLQEELLPLEAAPSDKLRARVKQLDGNSTTYDLILEKAEL